MDMTIHGFLVSTSRAAPLRLTCSVPADDWDLLFRAVCARLRLIVDLPPEVGGDGPLQRWTLKAHEGVLECTDDLGKLHVMLAVELERGFGTASELVVPRATRLLSGGSGGRDPVAACRDREPVQTSRHLGTA